MTERVELLPATSVTAAPTTTVTGFGSTVVISRPTVTVAPDVPLSGPITNDIETDVAIIGGLFLLTWLAVRRIRRPPEDD